jgi:hypothetical protein
MNFKVPEVISSAVLSAIFNSARMCQVMGLVRRKADVFFRLNDFDEGAQDMTHTK